MTAREFFNAMTGYYEQEKSREERSLMIARWQTCWIVNCFVTDKLSPKDLLVLDCEIEEAEERQKAMPIPTKEEFIKAAKSYGLKV